MHAFTSYRRHADLSALLLACLMLAPSLAAARPAVLEEVTRLTSPDPSLYLRGAVALDGNDLLVVATTWPGFPVSERMGQPVVLLHFERQSDGSWLSRGAIFSSAYDEYGGERVVLENGLGAVFVGISDYRLLERTATGWNVTRAVTSPGSQQVIFPASTAAVDGRTIALGSTAGAFHVVHLLEKGATGTWTPTVTLPGPRGFPDDEFIGPENVEFVATQVIASGRNMEAFPSEFETYVFDRIAGTWQTTGILNGTFSTIVVGDQIALRSKDWPYPGEIVSFETRFRPGGPFWNHHALRTGEWYANKRAGHPTIPGPHAFATASRDDQRGLDAGSVMMFGGNFSHQATLVASDASAGGQLGASMAVSGRRVAAFGWSAPDAITGSRTETIYVFEVPDPLPAVARVQDTFEDLNSAGWTPWGFTNWRVVSSGGTQVFRQTNTQGDARAIFEEFAGGNQSIQADLQVNAFAGTGTHWAGLMARYTDSRNFYYLMHGPSTLQIRKIVNGVFGPIASTPFTLQVGRKYRFRLEAVGTWLRAYVDDRLMLSVRDTSHSHGRTGLAMWKANAEYDNVVVSTSPYTTLHADSFNGTDDENVTPPWETSPVNAWARTTTGALVFRQSVASGDARAVHGAPTQDQIVTADIRPRTFHANGGWAGLMARYVDARTYYYVYLHSSGKASLRRWMDGRITVLDEATFTVTPGTSYRVRLDAIGSDLRLYVNGRLLAEAVDSAIPAGRYGLVTYRAAADFDNFKASRP